MPARNQPKGAYIRNTPDWFTGQMAFCGAHDLTAAIAGQSRFSTFCLFNNDNAGRSLEIYYISLSYEGSDMGMVDFIDGSFGTFHTRAFTLDPFISTPPGQSFLNSSAVPNPGINPDITSPIAFLAAAFTGQQFGYGAPLFIIRPGKSMRVSNDDSSFFNSITWWYRFS